MNPYLLGVDIRCRLPVRRIAMTARFDPHRQPANDVSRHRRVEWGEVVPLSIHQTLSEWILADGPLHLALAQFNQTRCSTKGGRCSKARGLTQQHPEIAALMSSPDRESPQIITIAQRHTIGDLRPVALILRGLDMVNASRQ